MARDTRGTGMLASSLSEKLELFRKDSKAVKNGLSRLDDKTTAYAEEHRRLAEIYDSIVETLSEMYCDAVSDGFAESIVTMPLSAMTTTHRVVLLKIANQEQLTMQEYYFASQMERFGLVKLDENHAYGAYLTEHGIQVYGQMFGDVT